MDDVSDRLRDLRGRRASLGERLAARPIERRRRELYACSDEVGDATEATGGNHRVAVADEARIAVSPADKARLLRRLVLAHRPRHVVELGAAFGISGAYVASGLHRIGGGRLTTVEGSPSRAEIARRTLAAATPADVEVEVVTGLFDDHLDLLAAADLVYVDGNHYPAPTIRYVEATIAGPQRDVVLVLDDIDGYSAEMDQVWDALRRDDRFAATGRAGDIGVLIRRAG